MKAGSLPEKDIIKHVGAATSFRKTSYIFVVCRYRQTSMQILSQEKYPTIIFALSALHCTWHSTCSTAFICASVNRP